MNDYEVTIISFDDEWVRYSFSDGETGTTGRKWFPDVEVGQVWKVTCKVFLIVSCVKIK